MNLPIRKIDKHGIYRAWMILVCVAVNVALNYVASRMKLPFYFDTIGTIFAAYTGGLFPGITTAVLTNLVCWAFNPNSLYFSLVGVLIAFVTDWFGEKDRCRTMAGKVNLIFLVTIISGVLSILIQWMLFGEAGLDYVADSAAFLVGDHKKYYFVISVFVFLGINLVDKGISVLVALMIHLFMSPESRNGLRYGGWKQAPLSAEDMEKINSNIRGSARSLRARIILALLTGILAMNLLLGIVGARMNPDAVFSKNYTIKSILVFFGTLALFLAGCIWLGDRFLVYPIGSLENAINDYLKNIDDQERLDESVKRLQKLDIRTNDELERLYRSVCEMAVSTTEQMRSIRMLADANEKMQAGLIITMADLVENRDSDTGAHIQKTAAYVRIIVDGLKRRGYYAEKLTDKYMHDVEMSAPLHDIGKINVPDAVLQKPGRLTEDEFAIMKTHTVAGKKILENAIETVSGESYLTEARNMAAYHHERWDGKGYPEGLHGQVIPLSARIMAVADVFDALTSPRVYKPPFSIEEAIKIIQDGVGTQFDPKCVEVFMESLPEVERVLAKYREESADAE